MMALCGLLACGMSGHAAAQGSPAATLPQMVVSGSMQEQPVDDLPQSIDVIDAGQIEEQQSQTLRDALQDLPNTSVRTARPAWPWGRPPRPSHATAIPASTSAASAATAF